MLSSVWSIPDDGYLEEATQADIPVLTFSLQPQEMRRT